MAINRFAILTDGFAKPGTIVGSDWASSIGRALLITEGYFNRALSGVSGKWYAFVLDDDHIMNLYL